MKQRLTLTLPDDTEVCLTATHLPASRDFPEEFDAEIEFARQGRREVELTMEQIEWAFSYAMEEMRYGAGRAFA